MRLIKFETDNCTPCKMVDSFLDSKSETVEKFDVIKDTDMTEKFGIMSVPALILLDEEGNEVARSVGFKPPEIEKILELKKKSQ